VTGDGMQDVYRRARDIRVAIFDVDGVLTDGRLYYSDAGEEMKAFDVHDGHGLRMLKDNGLILAIITSRASRCVEARSRNLGIDHLFQGVSAKGEAFESLLARCRVTAAECAYTGDDVVDLPVMTRCGLAFSVPGAPPNVHRCAHYVTRAQGGRGAVREVCELILFAQSGAGARMAGTAAR
jgi:3-deoxy-D-manno-octulosonate 8-phosphate phosphatase (KDO 8-P phosphatase)